MSPLTTIAQFTSVVVDRQSHRLDISAWIHNFVLIIGKIKRLIYARSKKARFFELIILYLIILDMPWCLNKGKEYFINLWLITWYRVDCFCEVVSQGKTTDSWIQEPLYGCVLFCSTALLTHELQTHPFFCITLHLILI